MQQLCPKCLKPFDLAKADQFQDDSIVICPHCHNVIRMGEDADADAAAAAEAEAVARKGPMTDIWGAGRRRNKRYVIWTIFLLVVFLGYQYAETVRKEEAGRQVHLAQLKTAMNRIAVAQEEYYAEHNTYADLLTDLDSYRNKRGVQVRFKRADGTSWAAEATFRGEEGLCCAYDSAKGGFQPACEGYEPEPES